MNGEAPAVDRAKALSRIPLKSSRFPAPEPRRRERNVQEACPQDRQKAREQELEEACPQAGRRQARQQASRQGGDAAAPGRLRPELELQADRARYAGRLR